MYWSVAFRLEYLLP
uniref:Uncharacterized protein n=1 Tax=Arundo donax TaxID=35708 RepID=A0A0A8YD15_ARUDO